MVVCKCLHSYNNALTQYSTLNKKIPKDEAQGMMISNDSNVNKCQLNIIRTVKNIYIIDGSNKKVVLLTTRNKDEKPIY